MYKLFRIYDSKLPFFKDHIVPVESCRVDGCRRVPYLKCALYCALLDFGVEDIQQGPVGIFMKTKH